MIDLGGLGLPKLEWGEIFHLGIRVDDLGVAQKELTESMGISWTTPLAVPRMPGWYPGEGYKEHELTISFSVEGPVHIELLVGSPGSYWDTAVGGAGVHHIGVWVEDIAKANDQLVEEGWTVELSGLPPEEGYGGFTYIRSPAGILFEPETCATGAKARFDRWYAGGNLLD